MPTQVLPSPSSSYYTRIPLFFFNDTATTEIYTLSLHDALPIWPPRSTTATAVSSWGSGFAFFGAGRSEEHTSELQSRRDLVCRLLLEKKNKRDNPLRRP